MNDTPRTDAEAYDINQFSEYPECLMVDADISRQLERELAAAIAERDEAKNPKIFKRDWVNCPICGETDMRREWFSDEEDGPYIKCVNIGCASNGGPNCDALMKSKFQGKSPIAYETALLLTKAVEAQCEATEKVEQERDQLRQRVGELSGEVCELFLCESVHLGLRPNMLYRFKVDEECKECRELEAQNAPTHS